MLVRLIGPGGAADPAGLPSRVEDVAAPGPGRPMAFRVVAPEYPGDLVDAEDSGPWMLTWVSDRGRWELPVRRTESDDPGPRSWWLTPAGQVYRNQRRSFYRAHCPGSVGVDVLADPFPTFIGRTLDLSEGGLRCLLPTAALDGGARVLVRLSFEGLSGTYPGVVVRSVRPLRSARVAGWHREAAIAFDDPEAGGDVLRAFVVRLQLKARRLSPP